MIDKWLARKVLNTIQKKLVKVENMVTDAELTMEIRSCISKLDLMYDILHLDEVDIIETTN